MSSGMISLAVVQMPSGMRSYLEDFVVDSTYRRRGVTTALLEAAIDHARNSGARSLDMTSRPSGGSAMPVRKVGVPTARNKRVPLFILQVTSRTSHK
jgi:GNAT superfamily N-acetyltransferase